MKKSLFLFIFIITFCLSAFSQGDTEEGLYFGGRPHSLVTIQFNKIENEVFEYELELKNSEFKPVTITNICIPKGFGVVLTENIIPVNSKIIVKILVYKEFLEEGDFSKDITFEFSHVKQEGIVVKSEITYTFTGTVE